MRRRTDKYEGRYNDLDCGIVLKYRSVNLYKKNCYFLHYIALPCTLLVILNYISDRKIDKIAALCPFNLGTIIHMSYSISNIFYFSLE